MSLKKHNFSVRHNPKKAKGSVQEQNDRPIRAFNRKYKTSLAKVHLTPSKIQPRTVQGK